MLYKAMLYRAMRIEHDMRRLTIIGQKSIGIEVKQQRWRGYEGEYPIVGGCRVYNGLINLLLKESGKRLVKNAPQQ